MPHFCIHACVQVDIVEKTSSSVLNISVKL